VLAIGFLAAAQAIDWRIGMNVSPNAPTTTRNEVGAVSDKLGAAEEEFRRFIEATRDDRRASIAGKLGTGTRAAYELVRRHSPPLVKDRVLEPDIRAVRSLIADGSLVHHVRTAAPDTMRKIPGLG
jgi:histidine ammonia-lyase